MLPARIPDMDMPLEGPLLDPFGRAHTYVRVSVTDRCNYRCTYCMPAEGLDWMPKEALLSYEEVGRIVRVLASMGVSAVRLTGGEPTVRRDLPELIEVLSSISGLRDIAMTTNGHLLEKQVSTLAEAGLTRVNISLDTLDPDQFRTMTRGGDLSRVLRAIRASIHAGLTPVKVNAVMVAGENDDQLLPMIEYFSEMADSVQLRFIEAMPFSGAVKERTHLSASHMRDRISERYSLAAVPRTIGVGPAKNWRIAETGLTIGWISPITDHFCGSCNRLRLMADGGLRTCLSKDSAPSLRDILRGGADDASLAHAIRSQVWGKVAGHRAHLEDDWSAFEGVMTRIGG